MKKKSNEAQYSRLIAVSTLSGFITYLLISFFFVRVMTWNLILFSAVLGPLIGNMIGFSSELIARPLSRKLESLPKPFGTISQVLVYFVVSLAAASVFFLIMDLTGIMSGLSSELLLVFLVISAGLGVAVTLVMKVYEHLKTELESSYEKLREKELLEQELQMARQVQAGFLPSGDVRIEGCEVATYFKSAKEVGGDYFDFLSLSQSTGIAIADVSGKGVPASLIMANLHATLHALAADYSLEDLFVRLNKSIMNNTAPGIFVTFFYGVLDEATGKLEYINAGHNPPLIVRQDGTVEALEKRTIGLGLSAEAVFESGSVTLDAHDTLLLYTDGLTEAGLPHVEPWGEENLKQYLPQIHQESPVRMTALILGSINETLKGIPQTDDIALILLKRYEQ